MKKRTNLTSIDLEKIQTEVSKAESIRVDDLFTNGGDLVRQVTLVWTKEMYLCRTKKDQQNQIDKALNEGIDPRSAFPQTIEYKQYKIGKGGLVIGKPSSRSCHVGVFLRWVNNPPRKKTKKCPHCGGTGRVPHEEMRYLSC